MSLVPGTLDLRRKSMIAFARPTDHAHDVLAKRSSNFDLDKTIFQQLDGPFVVGKLKRIVQAARLDIEWYWSDYAAVEIMEQFSSIPPTIPHDAGIMEFMQNSCNFVMEHADGSFMDHLQFCCDYSAAHFKGHSPRVMLLHSIMGVGTNVFPMDVSLVPTLQGLVTETEWTHVEAFPSILRLLLYGPLLQELRHASKNSRLESLKRITFQRVIDNKALSMDASAFWIHLNYQLMHLLDFLPLANWSDHEDNMFLISFSVLHKVLVRTGNLFCEVDFSLTPAKRSPEAAPPMSLGGFIDANLPSPLKRKMATDSVLDFSQKINHSLRYSIEWETQSRL